MGAIYILDLISDRYNKGWGVFLRAAIDLTLRTVYRKMDVKNTDKFGKK